MDVQQPLDMDAITAHLDRGWDLLQRGDILGARVAANHLLEVDGESPEGHTLLGAVLAAEGEAEEALDAFERAIDIDPEHVDALIYAAELAVYPLRRFDLALRFCDDLEGVLNPDEGRIDIDLLRAEICLAQGNVEQARQIMQRLPGEPYPSPTHALRIGRIWLDLDQVERAVGLFQEAARDEIAGLDARYYLGVALDALGQSAAAWEHLIAVHEGERALPDPPWAASAEAFAATIDAVLGKLPQHLAEKLRRAPLRASDYPPIELVAEGYDPRGCVFLAGIPAHPAETAPAAQGRRKRSRGSRRVDAQLSCLFVYKRNVERLAGSADAVAGELYRALVDEIAFFYALDDEEVLRLLEGAT